MNCLSNKIWIWSLGDFDGRFEGPIGLEVGNDDGQIDGIDGFPVGCIEGEVVIGQYVGGPERGGGDGSVVYDALSILQEKR